MKKKFNSRFPMARVKKIMQSDEDVGKIATATPVLISRALELFMQELIEKTADVTQARKSKTVSATHLKQCIRMHERFDFLKDLVESVPDLDTQAEEPVTNEKKRGRPKGSKNKTDPDGVPVSKKTKVEGEQPKKRGRKPKAQPLTMEDDPATAGALTNGADSPPAPWPSSRPAYSLPNSVVLPKTVPLPTLMSIASLSLPLLGSTPTGKQTSTAIVTPANGVPLPVAGMVYKKEEEDDFEDFDS
eukprot:GILJ01007310.1.p1 GENE.GILJ01007310.1~~GILJ01007310.1.p1  ORF type:complete len:259 (+),score=41.69 GILJ01007310.1:45-779(+)